MHIVRSNRLCCAICEGVCWGNQLFFCFLFWRVGTHSRPESIMLANNKAWHGNTPSALSTVTVVALGLGLGLLPPGLGDAERLNAAREEVRRVTTS